MAPKMMKPTLTGAHASGIFADMTVDGPEIGDLVVVMDRARNLPNRKTMGKQDPYCAARLGKEAKKTDTDRRGGQTPKWDQELRFTVHDSPDYFKLKVSVFNDDRKTDLIGETWIDLRDVVIRGGGQHDGWHGLNCKGRAAGEVRMEITYYDTREREEKAVEEKVFKQIREAERLRGPRDSNVKRRPLPLGPTTDNPPPQRMSMPASLSHSRPAPKINTNEPRLPRHLSADASEDGPVDPYEHKHQMMATHGLPFDPSALKRDGMMSYNGGPRPAPGQQGFTDLEKLSYRNRGLQLPETPLRADLPNSSASEVQQQQSHIEKREERRADVPASQEVSSRERLASDDPHVEKSTDSMKQYETDVMPIPASSQAPMPVEQHQSHIQHHEYPNQPTPSPIYNPLTAQKMSNYAPSYTNQYVSRSDFVEQPSGENSLPHSSWQPEPVSYVAVDAVPQTDFQALTPNFHHSTIPNPSYQHLLQDDLIHDSAYQATPQGWQSTTIANQPPFQTHWQADLESEDEGPPPPPPPHRSKSGPVPSSITTTQPPEARNYGDNATVHSQFDIYAHRYQELRRDELPEAHSAPPAITNTDWHDQTYALRPPSNALYPTCEPEPEPEPDYQQNMGVTDQISSYETTPSYKPYNPDPWAEQTHSADRATEQHPARGTQPLLSWPGTGDNQTSRPVSQPPKYSSQALVYQHDQSVTPGGGYSLERKQEPDEHVQYIETSHQPAPPLIKPRALSPRAPSAHLSNGSTITDSRETIPRKSVSPVPSLSRRPSSPQLAGIAFSPDSFNVLNPKAAAHHERTRRERSTKGSDEELSLIEDEFDPDEPIRDSTGRIVDPSDHLPSSTWAPEPEMKKPIRQSEIKLRFRGAVPMPAAAPRARRPSVELPEMRTSVQSPHITETPEPVSQSKPKAGKNKLQKRVRVLMTSGARPNTSETNRQESNTALRDLQNFNSNPTGGAMTARELRNREVYGDSSNVGPPVPSKIPLHEGQEENRLIDANTGVGSMDSLSREISSIDIGTASRARGKRTRFATTLM